MAITFPADCTASGDRTEYLYRLKERLRLRHNVEGAKLRRGEITQADFDLWLESTWSPRSDRVTHAILRQRARMSGQDPTHPPRWEPNLTDAD